jgi:hypothetical protein
VQQAGNEFRQALQDIALAASALQSGKLSLALSDVTAFESALAAALQDIEQVFFADLQAFQAALMGGASPNKVLAAVNHLASDFALILSEV